MRIPIHAFLLAAMLAASGAAAAKPLGVTEAGQQQSGFEADRRAILAMAGTYRVTFDFRETVPWRSDYRPIDAKVSGGFEVVRVIEDSGRVIRLQHLLVVGDTGKTSVVKHWRQDWTYEPESVLAYRGTGHWALDAVAPVARRGAWSQTVWQTDDSPRYGGVGRWAHDSGVPRWTSEVTWRPLARRDAVRKPVYDRYMGVNRHALTPLGWVHTQDNMKIGPAGERLAAYVQENVVNSYDRDTGFQIARADDYWAQTRDYWAAVRAAWDAAIARGQGVSVTEEAENGSVTGPRLMELADAVAAGSKDSATAIAEARRTIAAATGG